jgi:hypothetical protein
MKQLLAALALGTCALVSVQDVEAPTIRATETKAYVGRQVIVEDTIVEVSREAQSRLTYLNFGAPFPNHIFRAIVPDRVRRELATSVLASPWVRIRGVPQRGPGDIPEILCSEASHVSAIAPQGAASAGAGAPPAQPTRRPCCRVCTTGKACGNSCIARNRTCRQPPGCACNG